MGHRIMEKANMVNIFKFCSIAELRKDSEAIEDVRSKEIF